MRILSIDPGYERLGIAVLEKEPSERKERVLYSDCFKTSAKLPHSTRLLLIGEEIERVIREFEPKTLAIETLFLDTNHKTAMKVSEARGVILFNASRYGISICEYSPVEIKLAVSGYGKSSKVEMTKMVKLLVETKKDIKHDDEFDAIAVGIACFALKHKELLGRLAGLP